MLIQMTTLGIGLLAASLGAMHKGSGDPSSDREVRSRILMILNDNAGKSAEPPPSQLIAAGYTRVSMGMQLEGTSMEDQEDRIRGYILGQGWTLLDVITDPARSGRTSRREGFTRLKKLVRSGRIKVLVVDRLDRLARHLPTFLEFIDMLRKHDVKLVSLREGIDYRRAWGKLVVYILGALAEFYSDNLSQEMRIKRLTDAKNGLLAPTHRFGYCDGRCSKCTDPNGADPTGVAYCPHVGQPDRRGKAFRIPHPVESHAVRLMFAWYATGQYSFADIAHRLNTQIFDLPDGSEVHFRTKGRPGLHPPGPFTADAVRDILSNPVYAGWVPFAGSTEDGKRFRKPRE
ncbi:MAG: recombinase family protein, partial [Thermoflexales bacterium]|nr:recombinase family protein [Thermoflexales bacterium]